MKDKVEVKAKVLDIFCALCIILGSILVFYSSRAYPRLETSLGGSCATYPRLLAVIISCLAVVLLSGGLRKNSSVDSEEPMVSFALGRKFYILLIVLFLLLIMPYLINYLGMLLTIFIFSAITTTLAIGTGMTARSVISRILISAAMVLFVYLVFQVGAKVPLPKGLLFG